MPARMKILTSVATVVALLRLVLPADAATWTTEPVPAGPGALGPARVSVDAHGRALFLWDGVPAASQPRFTGMASRASGGGWTRLANLPGVGWGNAQALQYANTRVLFVSGRVASVGAYNRAKLRLAVAYGRSDGSGLGSWQRLASYETGFVASVSHAGQAIVAFDAGGHGLSTIERRSGGKFGRATKVSRPGAFAPAVAINARGDRIVAWIRAGRIEARVRNAGHGWGSVHDVAKAPGVPNTSLHAAVTRGGSSVLAWDVADIRESQPTRLIAGTAQRRPGLDWHVYPLESATLGGNGSLPAENAMAIPLVTGDGAIAITWTGAVDNNARVGVKAARLTSSGLRSAQVVSDHTANAALGDAAVGPSGQAAIVWSQFDDQARISTYAALSPGPGLQFGPADRVTPPETIGISGPAVGFQTVTGQAIAMVPIIHGNSDGFVSAIHAP
jgi:hypothetical protein